jgi:signal transduction histidine kinase
MKKIDTGGDMKYLYSSMIFTMLAINQITNMNINILAIASLLGALCLYIIKERYFHNSYSTIIFMFVALLLAFLNKEFIFLAAIPLFDLSYSKKIVLGVIAFFVFSYFWIQDRNYSAVFYFCGAVIYGYVLGEKDKNEQNHISTLDNERRLRYNLEQIQNELINSKKEIEHLTEIRERNRIAHEIHDNIGHSIAGVIFQLEGARRIINKDKEKAEEVLKLCSEKLAEALELTRNTVYNIRANNNIDIYAIEKIINNYKFCPVEFSWSGDFSTVSVTILKLLEANIKEFLTNASKYSGASGIQIKIDIGKKNVRLFYKDNGVGCKNIHKGLGIVGICDRVKNIGGAVAIDGNDGFLIVCNLPVNVYSDSL